MSTPLEDFLTLVLTDLPGCPSTLALEALRRSADEFCRGSRIWTEDLGPLGLVSGQSEYICPAPEGAVTAEILAAYIDGIPLSADTEACLDRRLPGWTELAAARPFRYVAKSGGTVRLVPEPTEDLPAALRFKASLAPSAQAAELPDFLAASHREALAHGAKARLFEIPGKPWTALDLAQRHRNAFREQLALARGRASKGRSGESLSARPRSFGRLD